MPHISADKAKNEYDVVIVGSGAGGGQSAYTLTLAGLKCVMLEAGRNYDPLTETPMFNTPAQAPLMGNSTPHKPFGFHDATVGGGWEVPGEPYTSVHQTPREEFKWWRPRMLGGRTNHCGAGLENDPRQAAPRRYDGPAPRRRQHEEPPGLLLGDGVRAGMQHQGKLSIDDGSSAAGAGQREPRHHF